MRHNFLPAVLVAAGAVSLSNNHSIRWVPDSGGRGGISEWKDNCSPGWSLPNGYVKYHVSIHRHLYSLQFFHSGIPAQATYKKATNAFILERASVSTLSFTIDDPSNMPSKSNDISDVVVDLYNGRRTASLRRYAGMTKSTPLVAIKYSSKKKGKLQSQSTTPMHQYTALS